ncbi:MAG: CopG family transcriptional regulator [Gemmatimonadota bacterium]
MPKTVREPIQVYLTAQERAELDQVAQKMGISRSEALRRGVRALEDSGYKGGLRDLADDGLVTPSTAGPGEPPPSLPVTSLRELLNELAADRRDR